MVVAAGGKQFFILFPLMKMNEDRMATGHGVGRGGCCLARGGFTTAIFPKKCRDTWPWPGCERASHTIGHENATFYGFIMRMVDQGGSRGMRRNTWLLLSTGFQVAEHCVYMYRYSAYVCTHVCTLHTRVGKSNGVATVRLSTAKPGNEPSRRPALLPNKIYIRELTRGAGFF